MKLMVKVLERSPMERQPWSPAFGAPVDRVAGVTDPSYPAISRIFVPLLLERWGDFDGWRNACHTLGIDLRADTLWSELSEASDIRQVSIGERQQGTFNRDALDSLVDVLKWRTTTPESVFFVVWAGYGGEADSDLGTKFVKIPNTGRDYIHDGSFVLTEMSIDWAFTRTLEAGFRFPVAIWPLDRAFVLATQIYHDSWYLSSESSTLPLLRSAGVEVLEIDRDAPLPSGPRIRT